MKNAPQQVEAAKLFYDPVTDWFALNLRREGAEHLVPHDKRARIIAIKIARIDCVMDAVMARRVHHRFKPARKTAYRFGMNPKLIDEIERAAKQQHRGMESNKRKRQTENKPCRKKASPCLPQCG